MENQPRQSTQIEALQAWLAGLRLGEPISEPALALVPIYASPEGPRLRYQILAAAIAAGDVVVTEAAQATVPTLRLINKGEQPVLILDGEEVVGGLQNRVVNTTLLIPAAAPSTCR